jgi:hypothetical protein
VKELLEFRNSSSCCCSLYGKWLKKFVRISEYPFTCWKCMIVSADSWKFGDMNKGWNACYPGWLLFSTMWRSILSNLRLD